MRDLTNIKTGKSRDSNQISGLVIFILIVLGILFVSGEKLLNRVFDLCEPFIGPPAITRDKRGVIRGVNLAPLFTQVAEYMGKELPFDGNPDYFSAEYYQDGTGGW